MKNIIVHIYLIFLLFSCTSSAKEVLNTGSPENRILSDLCFEDNTQIYSPRSNAPWGVRWFSEGECKLDSTKRYEGQYSLSINNQGSIYYYVDASRVSADSVSFEVKYFSENAPGGNLNLTIFQRDRYVSIEHPPVPVSDQTGLKDDGKWHTFTVKGPVTKEVYEMYFIISGDNVADIWIDDCRIEVDGKPIADFVKTHYAAEDDNEFDEASGIKFEKLTPQMLDNLFVLGRVWGFLKYYHPAITDGYHNWDNELFRIMPEVTTSKNKKERSKVLLNWINKLGPLPETKDYTVHNPEMYSRRIDLDWLENTDKFNKSLINKMLEIKDAYRSNRVNYYAIPFSGGARWKNFNAERSYSQITWDDQGYRILTLFRFWNVMEYCFPYRDLTDMPWEEVLDHYIPLFAEAPDESEYIKNILSLTARIDDSHGSARINSRNLQESFLKRIYSNRRYPALIDETANGEFVVAESYTDELKVGDEIIRISNEPIDNIITAVTPYVTCSNPAVLSRNIRNRLLNGEDSLPITIVRNGEQMEMNLKKYKSEKKDTGKKKEYDYAAQNILYFDAGSMHAEQLLQQIRQNPGTKGVIIDLRKYPKYGFIHAKIGDVILPEEKVFLWYSSYQLDYPGNYKLYNVGTIGRNNPDYYKGKIALLVNENTQSLGELSTIALRTAPNSAVIGSTTSGADGNATYFVLPGGIQVSYTVFGAYYPEWELCQRTGVKIDIPARNSVQDYKNGRDALIEKAIEYLLLE